jgi:UDP-N-acetylmuramoylalanine--D-glutamate ligase
MEPAKVDPYESALVLGLGASGAAAARLLLTLGTRVTVVDQADTPPLRDAACRLEREGVRVRIGCAELPPDSFSIAIASPGIPLSSPWVQALQRRGIPLRAELELGWRHCASPLLAVTGSNGKSTLVKLCQESLQRCGLRAAAGGNYGRPLSAVALDRPAPDWVVVEVSSFQLETVQEFRPSVGVLLNVNPNHLDRHGSLDAYLALKARLFARMGPADTAVLPDTLPAALLRRLTAETRRVTFGRLAQADCRFGDGAVAHVGRGITVSVAGSVFDNDVLGVSAAAAVAAVAACGVDPRQVGVAAGAFKRLPHRMETVAVVDGVTYVDDSKATNLAALAAGVAMASGPVRLIAGGLLKETDLEPAKKVLVKQVRGVYIIGTASEVMASAWQDAVACTICASIDEAVARARKEAKSGEVILLSPGCASFDQFRDFEDRGKQFCEIVRSFERGART